MDCCLFFIISPDYQVLSANSSAQVLLKNYQQDGQIPQRWQAKIIHVVEYKENQQIVINHIDSVLLLTFVLNDDNNVTVYGTDITQLNQQSAKLSDELARFKLMVSVSQVGIWEWELDSDQITLTSQYKTMLFYDNNELARYNYQEFIAMLHPEDIKQTLICLQNAIVNKNSYFSLSYRLKNKQDSYTDIQCQGCVQLDENGKAIRVTASNIDVSENKQAYIVVEHMCREMQLKTKKLETSNKELEQFAYIASHDLKAPLRAIANLSHWIEEDLEDIINDDTSKKIKLLRSRVLRMENLINGILEFSRIGHIELFCESINIKELLNEIVESLEVPQGCKIIIADNMPTIQSARIPLFQIFSNLISNAIKYHHDINSAQIHISTEFIERSRFEFSVSDNGPGIALEYHQKIFQIFQTLNARDRVESTGIGLTIVKKNIEQLGGKITVDSAIGQGSCFRFTVPELAFEDHGFIDQEFDLSMT